MSIILSIFSSQIFAADRICPDSIKTRQTIVNPPSDWHITSNDMLKHLLAGVGVYDGSVEGMGALVPDETGDFYSVWKFNLVSKEQHERGIWLVCGYSNTSITLSKRLPDNTSECRITYNPKISISGSKQVENVECK